MSVHLLEVQSGVSSIFSFQTNQLTPDSVLNHSLPTESMPTNLADQLGPDTIFRFVKSAPMRLEEGDLLSKEHPLMSIYIYGYAAEMTLKAAYFKNVGFSSLAEIDKDTRNRASALAQLHHFMGRDPHDILGWARFLIWDKANLHTPAYEPKMSNQIVAMSATVYENWRPQMRYRNSSPSATIVSTVRTAAAWLVQNYPRM